MKMPDENETDGRRLRSAASRERIINAVIALIDEDDGVPGAEAIAARAGVGLRSLFRHFGDMDSLYSAVLDQIGRRYLHMLDPYRVTAWPGQVREALARRMELFHGGLRYRRAADQYRAGSETMRHGRDAMDQMLRARLDRSCRPNCAPIAPGSNSLTCGSASMPMPGCVTASTCRTPTPPP